LRRTLEAISQLTVPSGSQIELIVVNNGSEDDTDVVVTSMSECLANYNCIWLYENCRGKSWALNRALKASTGSVLLFTDDDVLPPTNWVEAMCGPILSDEADAVAGGLRLGSEINTLGLTAEHRSWLATTEYCQRPHDPPLVGANMAISRRVFDTVPWFDPEVGPGATGHAEDTLFWLQVRAAGFRIISRYDIVAEHNPDPSRATRRGFVQLAEKHGEFAAYIDYHWNRIDRRHPYLALVHAAARLWMFRARHLPDWMAARMMPVWEMELLEHYNFRRWLLHERSRPPNYDRNGCVKLRGILPVGLNSLPNEVLIAAGA